MLRTVRDGERLRAPDLRLRARAAPRHVACAAFPSANPIAANVETSSATAKQRSLARPLRRGTLKRWPTGDDPDVGCRLSAKTRPLRARL